MLHARSDASEDQANAEARKSARKGHHQTSRCRDESRQCQRQAWTEPGNQPVARNLQPAHGAIVEGPDHRQTRHKRGRTPTARQAVERKADPCSRRAEHAPYKLPIEPFSWF
jgi:hypothetical protein